jgi:hypothetical protein
VDTKILRSGIATTGTVEAGHRLTAAGLDGLPQDIPSLASNTLRRGFPIWHGGLSDP